MAENPNAGGEEDYGSLQVWTGGEGEQAGYQVEVLVSASGECRRGEGGRGRGIMNSKVQVLAS